jgi:hypothetical protein
VTVPRGNGSKRITLVQWANEAHSPEEREQEYPEREREHQEREQEHPESEPNRLFAAEGWGERLDPARWIERLLPPRSGDDSAAE